jgi:transcriptional regulator with XRE-family HTH domain
MSLKLFAKNLRHRRMALGLTQTEIAKRLHLSNPKVYQHWEKGRCWPRFHEVLLRLMDLLHVDSIDKFIRTDISKAKHISPARRAKNVSK